ncbi:alpha/beta fold hydrolase [Ilumatobacter sp.]|uniref:alpha/beta fold hydrolase n=1 Tax=Ilumatobacter sp. TaxID=1967498 RepID=UPI003C38D661
MHGRGEFFIRRHVHPDPDAPTVLLLHGWTASADLQFIAAYRALAERYSFVGIDHRGHGRGFRSNQQFEIADVADDAAAVLRELGIESVIALGYSMGGPVALHLARRHRDLVDGLVVQATALEWRATLRERLTWRMLPLMGVALRSWTQPRLLRRGIDYVVSDDSPYAPYRDWMTAETMRNEPRVMVQAGKALSRYDARDWASALGVPAAMLLSTEDRLVRPRKQRELARALDARIIEVPMDHLGALDMPDQFASATVELVSSVVDDVAAASVATNDSN